MPACVRVRVCEHVRVCVCVCVRASDLLCLLVEDRGHGQQGGALIQRGGEALPVLVQLGGDLLDLQRGVVPSLHQPAPHGHDAVDVHVGILGTQCTL